VTYDDGRTERIVTDDTWKSHDSPVLSSDFMLGEDYDARLEVKGWDKPGLDEASGIVSACAMNHRVTWNRKSWNRYATSVN